MLRLPAILISMFAFVLVSRMSDLSAQDKDKKELTATVTGILKSRTEIKNRKDVLIEILGDGEEKARRYGVPFVPKGKGPIAEVLDAVNKANVGDRVSCDLVYGAYGFEGGYTVTAFRVLKKADPK